MIHVRIPPLRERRDDIPALLDYFLSSYARTYGVEPPHLPPDVRALLHEHNWPGNVRELMHLVEQLTVRLPGRQITQMELPSDIGGLSAGGGDSHVAGPAYGAWRAAEARALFERIVRDGESFWSIVYEPFMARDLMREHVRSVVTLGLEQTRGSYKSLVQYLHMPPTDYKRFLNFLRKHQCQVPFQGWRAMPVRADLPADDAEDRRPPHPAAVRG